MRLSEWERMAIEAALEAQISSGEIHSDHGKELLAKISSAQWVVLMKPKPFVDGQAR